MHTFSYFHLANAQIHSSTNHAACLQCKCLRFACIIFILHYALSSGRHSTMLAILFNFEIFYNNFSRIGFSSFCFAVAFYSIFCLLVTETCYLPHTQNKTDINTNIPSGSSDALQCDVVKR